MPVIDSDFAWGKELYDKYPELIDTLGDMYSNLARAINKKPDIVFKQVNPASTDFRYVTGTIWVNQNTKKVYILTDKPNPSTASWELIN